MKIFKLLSHSRDHLTNTHLFPANDEGYIVYRDEQAIAILAPNSTNYVDVTFVATGNKLCYFIEAFNQSWQVRSSTITYGCQ